MKRAFAQFPDLHGGWPSGDANWSWWRQPGRVASTNGRGLARVLCTAGQYHIDMALPGVACRRTDYFLAETRQVLEVQEAGRHRLVVEAARPVTLSVVDARSKAPIDRIEVRADARRFRHGVKLVGRQHTLWLPGKVATVFVTADGYTPTAVTVGREPTISEVLLWPKGHALENLVPVRFVGAALAQLQGTRVTLIGERVGADGRALEVWREDLRVDPTGKAAVAMLLDGPLRISARAEDGRFSIRGPTDPWTLGMEMHFEVLMR
jgi:hypothetical protein